MANAERIVGELETAVQSFRDRLAPAAVEGTIELAMEKLHQQFSVGETSVLAPDAAQRVEAMHRKQYDDFLRADAVELEKRIEAEAAALDVVLAEVSTLPDPLVAESNVAASDTLHEQRQTRILMELDRSERRLVGRTPTEVLSIYTAASDRDVVRFVIEDAARRGDLRFAPSADPTALSALLKAIEKTQRDRVAAAAPELVQAERRLTKIRKSATWQSLLDHLKKGRGFATAPRPRAIRIVR